MILTTLELCLPAFFGAMSGVATIPAWRMTEASAAAALAVTIIQKCN